MELGDNLILRRATQADVEALVEFDARIHSESEDGEPDQRVGTWVRDLMSGSHPTFPPEDFTLVIDSGTGKIVSSLNLISQTWSYGGIPFGVGRPELVGTDPEYRNRGLIRAQFDVIHKWSEERGEMVQAITGIPYYYRLFGYEMALDLGGGRQGFAAQVPKLKEGEEEPFRFRPIREADLPQIMELYQASKQRSMVNSVRDMVMLRYELFGKSAENVNRSEARMVEAASGETVGYIMHSPILWGSTFGLYGLELKSGISYSEVAPSLLRYVWHTGETMAKAKDGKFETMYFSLGPEHPLYAATRSALPRVNPPYAWYLRVADIPGFLRHISPVLEQNVEQSPLSGHTGELKLTFYRSGLCLKLEKGKLTSIEAWKPEPNGISGNAAFPGLTFLQMVFGYRNLEELRYAFPDVWWQKDEHFAMLNALFPKRHSDVWGIA